jgi:IS30 family transposase
MFISAVKGEGNASAVGTLVERTSRLLMLVKLPHPKSASAINVLQAFTDKLCAIAQPIRKTLTYDQGKEMALHKQLTANTGMAVYFCDSHSPWQRDSNENTNGLLRQFLPKGTDLSTVSQTQLNDIARLMNARPRQTLGWRTPDECMADEIGLSRVSSGNRLIKRPLSRSTDCAASA